MSTQKGGVLQVVKIVFLRLRFIFIFVVIGIVSWKWELIMNTVDKYTRPKQSLDMVQGDYEWFCPMHPTIIRSDDQQKCPICGMPLSKRKRGGADPALPGGRRPRPAFSLPHQAGGSRHRGDRVQDPDPGASHGGTHRL